MHAIIKGQFVDVEVLREKKILWWKFVLVKFPVNLRDDYGNTLYKTTYARWILKSKLLSK